MLKNLILIHLESLNRISFEHNINHLPNLKKLLSSSRYYENYFSSATSTYMVITDLFYGNSEIFEHLSNIKDMFSVEINDKDIFTELQEQGYTTQVNGVDIMGTGEEFAKIYSPSSTVVMVPKVSDDFYGGIAEYIATNNKFAMFLLNLESHLEGYENIPLNTSGAYCEIYQNRFEQLDSYIGHIFDILKETDKYQDTCVVLYGDHGDDFWGHGLHDGYTHAIEAIPFLINCPLIVWNADQSGECVDDLVSTVDLANLVKKWIGLDYQYKAKRKYIFSRNLFAGQPTKSDSLNKSYMVSDGRYALLASSVGLKMYCNPIDPLNSRNLLDFFYLKKGKLSYNNLFNTMKSSHYRSVLNQNEITEIIKRFASLKKILEEEISILYKENEIDIDLNNIDYDFTIKDQKLIDKLKMRLPGACTRSLFKSLLGDGGTEMVRNVLCKIGL